MILAIDLGTTATKVSLVSNRMEILASGQRRVPTYTAQGGVSEQNPQDWLDRVVDCVQELLRLQSDAAGQIEAIAVTGHMLGCLPVDHQGRPLYRHLLHGDRRSARQVARIDNLLGPRAVFDLSGNQTGPSTLGKIAWFKQEQPEIYQQTAYFLQSKDYVTGWLTGVFGTTDYSDASHGSLIDVRTLNYPTALYQTLGLDLDKLPRLHKGTDLVGTLCDHAAAALGLPTGIPVAAGAGDGSCSAVGAGAAQAGDHYCSLGTTAWTAYMAEAPVFDRHMRNINIVSADGSAVGSFGTIQNAGSAIDWALKNWQVSDLTQFDELAATAAAGSRGLLFLPYLTGERTPHFDPLARGVFLGIDDRHDQPYFLRAVIEGISMALRDTIDMHEENGLHFQTLKLIGGGGRSLFWRQVLADVLDMPITRINSPSQHATTVGAAVVAGTAVGLFSQLSEGTAQIAELDRVLPEPEAASTYRQLFPIYQSLYPSLKSAFKQLASTQA